MGVPLPFRIILQESTADLTPLLSEFALLLEFLIPKRDDGVSEAPVALVWCHIVNSGMIVLEIVPGNVAAKILDGIIEV